MTLVIGALISCVVAWALTGLMLRYAQRRNLLDHPGARSSHTVPTPRGGGVAVVVVFLMATLVLAVNSLVELRSVAVVGGCGLMVAAIGFIDDHRHVSPICRLLVHGVAALGAVLMFGGLPDLVLGADRIQLGWIGVVIGTIAIVWMVNLYNFMDGIDGIAAVEAITVAGGVAAIVYWRGNSDHAMWLALLSASVLGFLIWNWPPAKIFMGDAGSGFLGFVLAALALTTSREGLIELWSWVILLGVFVSDATVTLLRRFLRGERIYEAHRSHAYQHAARRFGGHKPVTATVGIINLVWLLPLAWFATVSPALGWLLMLIAYLPLVVLAVVGGAGTSEQDLSKVKGIS